MAAPTNLDGLFSAVGGKWTTSRELAEKVTNTIAAKLGGAILPCITARMRLPGGWIDNFEAFVERNQAAYPDVAVDHLARLYGNRLSQRARPRLRAARTARAAVVVRRHRRTSALCRAPGDGDDARRRGDAPHRNRPARRSRRRGNLRAAADLMARELDWDDARRDREIEIHRQEFSHPAGGPMSAFVVVNPRSGGGRTAREWPAIERALADAYPGMSAAMTERRAATRRGSCAQPLPKAARRSSPSAATAPSTKPSTASSTRPARSQPDAVFGFVTSGTGGDFRKTFGIAAGHARRYRTAQGGTPQADRHRPRLLPDKGWRADGALFRRTSPLSAYRA